MSISATSRFYATDKRETIVVESRLRGSTMPKFPSVPGAVMSKSRCAGCYNNVYNGELAKECWSLPTAVVVLKKPVHVDERPPWRATPQELPDCYTLRRFIYVQPTQEK